eukprot:TRINITY_DN71949_c0_g1_i1.p1 TRINITY_DN71949_c0_g1~~TRINITY_DN71949_c0_g1_i1.p1  ORF type:complete len:412 (-),score=86.50 TRINITY_DN71949_c0_g1_i1:360-1595(-)
MSAQGVARARAQLFNRLRDPARRSFGSKSAHAFKREALSGVARRTGLADRSFWHLLAAPGAFAAGCAYQALAHQQVPSCDGPEVDPKIIDGTAISRQIRAEIKEQTAELKTVHGVTPGLAVILVGNRPDSAAYVRMKMRAVKEVGFHSVDVTLPADVSEKELLAKVEELNQDPKVHGILVQLPLPKHIDEPSVLKSIKVEKDVDGFSALNIGNLCLKGGDPPLAVPCTPAGCVELLQRSGVKVAGKEAVVLGRSNIVGMPVAALLQSMNATVTVCHSGTKDIQSFTRRADIIVAAIGKREYLTKDMVKPGAVIIDVGINEKEDPSRKSGRRLVGDVDYEGVKEVAGKITPVPGGVGPMTITMLLQNTINLARHASQLDRVPLRKPQQKERASVSWWSKLMPFSVSATPATA